MISKHTGRAIELVRKDIDRDKILTAEEAKDYGLIDQVLGSRKKTPVATAVAANWRAEPVARRPRASRLECRRRSRSNVTAATPQTSRASGVGDSTPTRYRLDG